MVPGPLIVATDEKLNRFYDMADFPDEKRDAFEPYIHVEYNIDLFKISLTKRAVLSNKKQ